MKKKLNRLNGNRKIMTNIEVNLSTPSNSGHMPIVLQSIQFKNFRGFETEQNLDFKKLTIFTGANSSGKSSILYSLLSPLQSKGFPYVWSLNGRYINMGDFKEVVNKHNEKSKIQLGFKFFAGLSKNEFNIQTSWIANKLNNLPELEELRASSPYFNIVIKKTSTAYSLDFSYDPLNDPSAKEDKREFQFKIYNLIETATRITLRGSQKKVDEKEGFEKYLAGLYSKIDIKNVELSLNEVDKKIKTEANSARINKELKDLSNIFKELDSITNFISSFRLHPDRTYLERSRSYLKLKSAGEGYLDQIIEWHKNDKRKYDEFLLVLKRLKMIYSFDEKRIGGGRYEIVLQSNKGGVPATLNDTGFGISQFLPIIVADLQLPQNSLLFISQPEIHLHPSAQANFGDFIAGQMKSKKKNYVIETHSEYFLNRIRLQVSKGNIKTEDVVIYHVENKGTDSRIHKITLDSNGNYINAPKTFFETYYIDIKNIALNSFE